GNYDPKSLGVFDKGGYVGDLLFVGITNDTALIYNIYGNIAVMSELYDSCHANQSAIIYIVNTSRTLNISLNVRGLGYLGPERLIVASNPQLITDNILINGTGVTQWAQSPYYRVERINNKIIYNSVILDNIAKLSRGREWILDRRYCLLSTENIGNGKVYRYYPAVVFNKSTALIYPMLGGPVAAYDAVSGLLVWMGVPPGHFDYYDSDVILPNYIFNNLSNYLIKIYGISTYAELRLESVNMLNTTTNLTLSSTYNRSPIYSITLVLLFGFMGIYVIARSRNYVIYLGLVLLVVGLSLLMLSSLVSPFTTVKVDTFSFGSNTGAFTEHVYMVGDKNDNFNFLLNLKGCEYATYNVSLYSPGGLEDNKIINASTLTLNLNLSSEIKSFYHLVIKVDTPNAVCEGKIVNLDVRVTYKSGSWSAKGILMKTAPFLIILGIMIILLTVRESKIRPGLTSLYSSIWGIDIISLIMMLLYVIVFIYSANESLMSHACPFWNACIAWKHSRLLYQMFVLPREQYVYMLVHTVVVASLLYAYLLESGIEKRIILMGISVKKRIISKLIVSVSLVVVPATFTSLIIYSMVIWQDYIQTLHLVISSLVVIVLIVLLINGLVSIVSWFTRSTGQTMAIGLALALGLELISIRDLKVSVVASKMLAWSIGLYPLPKLWLIVMIILIILSWFIEYYLYLRGNYVD
ncbi:MAG: hypothetical protein F7B78_07475, partial [Desulfurococcales archaeon]|nr:hypothetical protein [Desulfurococcales archaeon]